MPSACEQIKQQLGGLYHCEQVGEYTRVQTPLLYPDGDFIDVFIKIQNGAFVLTDLGETVRWLKTHTISNKRTKKQLDLIAEICSTTGVSFFKGMIVTNLNNSDKLASKLMDVSQTALKVADLSLLFRSRSHELFAEEVEEFLTENRFAFDVDPTRYGRSGRVWKPNFQVRYQNKNSYVFTLSTGNRSVASSLVNKVFTAWTDLTNERQQGPNSARFISLIDDNDDVWTDADINLLSGQSDVAFWRRQDEFADMLRTA